MKSSRSAVPSGISRRSLLAALGACALATPFSRVGSARADVPQIRRLVVFYTHHGTVMDNWKLPGSGFETPLAGLSESEFSPILRPLWQHRDKLLALEGVEMVTADNNRVGNEHDIGTAHSLTAANMNPDTRLATGISIDQLIANTIAGQTAKKSVELGIRAKHSHSYVAPEQRLPCENKPVKAFDSLFQDFVPGADQEALKTLRDQKRSILDFVTEELKDVQARSEPQAKAKLEQHLDQVRDLETRLGVVANCEPFTLSPEERNAMNYYTYGEYGTDPGVGYANVAHLMNRIITTALGCDLTRVININCGQPPAAYFGGESGVDVHQAYAHQADKNDHAKEMMTKYAAKHAEAFGELIGMLDAASLLDSTLVVWCGELATGNHKFGPSWPVVMAGGLGGELQTGRYLRYPSETSHSDLWLAVAQKMGCPVNTFGEPEYCTGPLSGLG